MRASKPVTEFGRDRQKSDGLTSRCKVCRRAEERAYAQSDAGKASASRRRQRYYAENAERMAAWTRAWREKHPGYSAEANRKWREANPGAAAAYHQANRDKAVLRGLERRARKTAATIGPIDLKALWDSNQGRCQLCGGAIDPSLRWPDPMSQSVDHIVPLSKGGTHEQSNLQWTHLVCNIRKGATVPD